MRQKFVVALTAAAVIAGGVASMPTQASAQCWWWGCGPYYTYGWYPTYKPVHATYAQPVLVKKPVTTYVYEWSTRPVTYTYYAPAYRRVVYEWRYGAPPVVAKGK